MNHKNDQGDCCHDFQPAKWDNLDITWYDKPFIRDSVPQLFHFPLPGMIRRTINRLWKQATDAKADPPLCDFLLLAHDPSPWKSELYVAVTREVPGAENVRLSGNFITKIFDGPFSRVPQFVREMDISLSHQHKLAKKYYFYFATCRNCYRKYGHNYIVAFAEV